MSSPKNSPGEARKQNGSRKRKRPSSLDSDANGASKYKSCRVVRNHLYKIAESYWSPLAEDSKISLPLSKPNLTA